MPLIFSRYDIYLNNTREYYIWCPTVSVQVPLDIIEQCLQCLIMFVKGCICSIAVHPSYMEWLKNVLY